jgi:dihydropyrimidinase
MAQARTIIKGGTVVTTESAFKSDLLIVDELVAAVGANLPETSTDQVIDAHGCMVLPGIIDAHTHIQLDTGIYQTPDDWLIGTKTAACGGVTTVIDFATQFSGQGLAEAVANRCEEARNAVIDYGLHCMVTDLPPGREGELAELAELGVPSVKLYTTYRPNYYTDDATILRLLQSAAENGILTTVHCENEALVAAATEALVAAGKDRPGLPWTRSTRAGRGGGRPPRAFLGARNRRTRLYRSLFSRSLRRVGRRSPRAGSDGVCRNLSPVSTAR